MLRASSWVRSRKVSLNWRPVLSSYFDPKDSRQNTQKLNHRARTASMRDLHPEGKNTGADNTVNDTVSGMSIAKLIACLKTRTFHFTFTVWPAALKTA